MMRTLTRGSKKGFSLLELIVILVLVALVVGVVMPSFSRGLRGLELETSGRDLITRMRHARSQAIAKQKVFRVILQKEEDETVSDYYIFANEFEQEIRKLIKEIIVLNQINIIIALHSFFSRKPLFLSQGQINSISGIPNLWNSVTGRDSNRSPHIMWKLWINQSNTRINSGFRSFFPSNERFNFSIHS